MGTTKNMEKIFYFFNPELAESIAAEGRILIENLIMNDNESSKTIN